MSERNLPNRIETFAAKVDKRSHDECWPWLAGKVGDTGYGKVKIGGETFRAHRVSWELFFGPIPEGKMVLHKCNNPGCVNPYHLYLGDGIDNAEDRARAGHTKGGRPPHKFSKENVEEVHRLLLQTELTQREIGEMFGTSQQTISSIKAERCPHYVREKFA